jgi:H2-forming N5,N10-methylenetetrahydromethanopterin dehydrogenase-like enzyme
MMTMTRETMQSKQDRYKVNRQQNSLYVVDDNSDNDTKYGTDDSVQQQQKEVAKEYGTYCSVHPMDVVIVFF